MRPRVEWMTQADERVLEFLFENEIIASPSEISANVDYTGEYISRRCRRLADSGLIQRVDATNYRTTKKGEQYLSGELDAADLESDEN